MKAIFISMILFHLSISCISQNGGVFPPEPFNGMQVNYNITGATISKFEDKPGFTWSRNLTMSEISKTGIFGISGSLQAGGYSCTVKISISVNDISKDTTIEVYPEKPQTFSLYTSIPKNPQTANINIQMHGHYSMGGGSRYVIVQANHGRYGAEFESTDPNKGKPAPSKVAVEKLLNEWFLKEYNKKIKKGVLLGPTNNLAAVFDPQTYDPYACSSYEKDVLELLDKAREDFNSEYKYIFDHYDYGPIQYGLSPGIHRCVVIYPKGKDWKTAGTVLDPWIKGKPEKFTIEEHKKMFKVPVQGDHWAYDKKYPTTGSTGYENQGYFKNLEKRGQQKMITSHCPLYLYITDKSGRISGFAENSIKEEIPEIGISNILLEDGTYWTELIYPDNKNYKVIMKGIENGKATIYSINNLLAQPNYRSAYKYELNCEKGEEFTLDQSLENSPIYSHNSATNKKQTIYGNTIVLSDILNTDQKKPDIESNTSDDAKDLNNDETNFLENLNEYVSRNNPNVPTQFKLENSAKITKIQNFHTNVANGSLLKIKLMSSKGQIYGPWTAKKIPFEGFDQYECWQVVPNVLLPPGIYTLIDSDPGTWLTNVQANNRGFSRVLGIIK